MSKEQMIKRLSKVKLIIGNGFDLHCHMKTSYKDFFLFNQDKNNRFKLWFNDYLPKLKEYRTINGDILEKIWTPFENFSDICIWDFYFYINSGVSYGETKEWLWCDIEDNIKKWLIDNKKTQVDSGKPHWHIVYDIINNYGMTSNERELIMASIVFKKHNEMRFKDIDDFYLFLLDELKIFEKKFGLYIDRLHYSRANEAFGIITPKTGFRNYAIITIQELCNPNNLSSIDSFNYDDLENEELNSKLININGGFENPIFGIDSNTFPASDIRSIFSKTNRRMELDMLSNEERENVKFDNVVIYGHSLNEADYSYFFSVFDKLKISDLDNDSKIVFAYSIYDTSKEQQIKSDFRISISKMFYEYSVYLGKDKQPNRLLDVLTSQGKILLYEIEELINA